MLASGVELPMALNSFGPDSSYQSSQSLVNTETGRVQAYSDVASFDGGSVIVWSSFLQDGSGWGVFGQQYDGMGQKYGEEFQVNTTTQLAQYAPTVSAFDNGDFVVAWMSVESGMWDIHTQMFQADGARVGGENVASTFTGGHQIHPVVETLTNGNYVVAWQGWGHYGAVETQGIFGRIFNQSGQTVSGNIPISDVNFGGSQQFDLSATPDGGFAIAHQGVGRPDNNGIYVRTYDHQGYSNGRKLLVNQFNRQGAQTQPSLATGSEGNMFVTWTSRGDGSSRGVFVQQIDAEMNLVDGPTQVAQEYRGSQWRSEIALKANGNFVVTWQGRGYSDLDGVFIREFDSDSQAVSDEFRVSDFADGLQRFAAVDASQSGVTVAWHGKGEEDAFGVYTRLFQSENTAPIATDFDLGTIARGTKLNVNATDIISEFGTDIDSVLDSMSVRFEGVTVGGGMVGTLMDVGFSYMSGMGPRGGFMIDTLAQAFDDLTVEQTIDVVIDFIVSDGMLEDTGQFTFTVSGKETELDQADFQFLGDTVVGQEITATAGGTVGRLELNTSLT